MSQLETVAREVGSLEQKLDQARRDLALAEQNILGAEARYDAVVHAHYDGGVSDADLERARAARTALGHEPDRLQRVIKFLEEQLREQRSNLAAAQLQEARAIGEAASQEISGLFLRILDKQEETNGLQVEMNAIVARTEGRAKSLGNNKPVISVNYAGLRNEWKEKRGRQDAAAD